MSKIAAIIFVRMGSKRLYGKALKKIGNKTTLEIIIERIKRASKGIKVIIATSNSYSDNKIYLFCKKKNSCVLEDLLMMFLKELLIVVKNII